MISARTAGTPHPLTLTELASIPPDDTHKELT
jgi:hypothetical protein